MIRSNRNRGSARPAWLVIAALVIGALLGGGLLISLRRSRPTPGPISSLLPDIAIKPKPLLRPFNGCPPEGDGGDPDLNHLKNRVDEGQYVSVPFDAVEKLDWPPTVERRRRAEWSTGDSATVSRYEGIPISVEGYLAGSRQEGPESPNCHGADASFKDFHIWLTQNAGQDRSQSIVVEMTPAMRAQHSNWTTTLLGRIARDNDKVRVSGWLMLDPEHPDQVGKTRGTIWEIHPVMRFEVEQNGHWVALDTFSP
jgi:hypothetical protein